MIMMMVTSNIKYFEARNARIPVALLKIVQGGMNQGFMLGVLGEDGRRGVLQGVEGPKSGLNSKEWRELRSLSGLGYGDSSLSRSHRSFKLSLGVLQC